MKNKKRNIIIITISLLIIVIGLTYALMTGTYFSSSKNVSISGDIYMHFNGSDMIQISNAIPMTKEEALEKTDDYFEFIITGKNTSEKDIYYGIGLEKGEVPSGKTNVNESDIMVYLLSGEDILVDGVRYQDFKSPVYVDKINAGTNSEISKNYKMKVWLREGIIVSDTEDYASYTTSEWENLYMSLKVKVDANMNYMNIPLTIEHDNESVENNKQFFITRVSNYLNPEEVGEMLDNNDNMTLEITSDSDNIEFTYKDSTGNEETEASDTLTLNYIFNKKQSEEVKVFVTSKNDSNTNTDINVKLTKNNLEVYEQVINMDIKGNNYCLNNGFDKLGDCILVSEIQSKSVSDAKKYINTKTYNLDDTAPSYAYVEDVSYNVENPSYNQTSGYKFYFGEGIEFNATSGTYKLTGTITTDNLSSTYVGKYTCGTTNYGPNGTACSSVVKILAVDDATSKITKADTYTYKIASTLRSEVGIYKTVDDYGDTYFFRGDVENNNVYFAGYYWKIVRMNGDSSIRLIYNGEIPNATGNAVSVNNTTYTYSVNLGDGAGTRYSDPTYVGYMYGDDFSDTEITSPETTYGDIVANNKYYFAKGYAWDDATNTFYLTGDDIKNKTYLEMNSEGLFGTYPYTCVGSAKTNKCQVIVKINSYVSETRVKGNYISYSSTSLDATRTNEKSSNVKQVLDTWYETNIKGKSDEEGNKVEDYITDGTFCNDRSITSGNGYSLVPNTYYSSYNRLYENSKKSATLECNGDIRDKFSKTNAYGNAKLSNPVALITADEVALGGAKYGMKNSDYYLRTNGYFWTMTPYNFSAGDVRAHVYHVLPTGELNLWGIVNISYGVRAVINLRSDILIQEGDGTVDNPFKLKLS